MFSQSGSSSQVGEGQKTGRLHFCTIDRHVTLQTVTCDSWTPNAVTCSRLPFSPGRRWSAPHVQWPASERSRYVGEDDSFFPGDSSRQNQSYRETGKGAVWVRKAFTWISPTCSPRLSSTQVKENKDVLASNSGTTSSFCFGRSDLRSPSAYCSFVGGVPTSVFDVMMSMALIVLFAVFGVSLVVLLLSLALFFVSLSPGATVAVVFVGETVRMVGFANWNSRRRSLLARGCASMLLLLSIH